MTRTAFGNRMVMAAALIVLLLAPAIAQAQALKGVALVIGQSKYETIPALGNAGNDAKAMGRLLEELGFTVSLAVDRNARRLTRDLENFVADARDEKADVAVIYYSGHGIEAAGENFLVATDSTGVEGLVPVSDFLAELKSSIPVSIILLDACRTNPFPPGLAIARNGSPAAPAAAGLGVPRGFADADGASPQGIGMVIGFSATPGTAALDGAPGGNSPYAAALLRHLTALRGAEFGQIMRMVTEEVYLKTQGRQRPWVNESLTKFLYFGGDPSAKDAVQSRIDDERRPLLLMIADLPQERRAQIETLAAAESVPLDTLYGVLRALGETELPQDPDSLDRLLREKASQLRRFSAERAALASDDPEISKLSAAADQAIAEGAIAAARDFLDRAKTRIEATRSTIDTLSAELRNKRIANAAIFAKSGEAAALSFDYQSAARDFGAAFDWVKDEDRQLAWKYLWSQGLWQTAHGEETGDTASIAASIATYEQSLDYVSLEDRPQDWANSQNDLAVSLRKLGEIAGDVALLNRAIAANEQALRVRTREAMPEQWASTQMNLGNVRATIGRLTGDSTQYPKAVTAYLAAQTVHTKEKNPRDWSNAQTNLGIALKLIGDESSGTFYLKQAVTALEAVVAVRDRNEVPLEWAAAQGNLGSALASLGERETGTATLMRAVAAYEAALTQFPRDRVPIRWARMQNNLGDAWRIIGEREKGTASLEKAAAALEAAREVRGRDSVPMQWALTTANLGLVLGEMAERRSDGRLYDQSRQAYAAALEVFTPDRAPAQWNMVAFEYSHVLLKAGQLHKSKPMLREGLKLIEAVADYEASRGQKIAETTERIAAFRKALGCKANSACN